MNLPLVYTQPSFQIVVIDPVLGTVSAVFDPASIHDLRYSRVLNDIGVLTLRMPYSSANRQAFKLDSLIEIYRTSPITGRLAKEDTYFARLFNRYRQGQIEDFIVGGVQLNDLIRRRVVDPADDPNAAGGYSTYAGAADTVLYNYAYYNLGPGASVPRRFPNLTIPVPQGIGNPVGYRLRYDDLLKTLFQDATTKGAIDFNIQRTSGANLELDLAVIGTDRRKSVNYPTQPWTGLDPQRGNMQDPNLTIDRKTEKNTVYALGQGQDVNRQLIIQTSNPGVDSPWNRCEYTDTNTNAQKGDTQTLLTAAVASLNTNQYKQVFSFKLTEFLPGGTYQQDWFLGDKVTVYYGDYSDELRIQSVEVFISSAGQTILPTVAPI